MSIGTLGWSGNMKGGFKTKQIKEGPDVESPENRRLAGAVAASEQHVGASLNLEIKVLDQKMSGWRVHLSVECGVSTCRRDQHAGGVTPGCRVTMLCNNFLLRASWQSHLNVLEADFVAAVHKHTGVNNTFSDS